MGQDLTSCGFGQEDLQLGSTMSDDAKMTTRTRITALALALALLAVGCGDDGQSDADRGAVSDMLERLGRSRLVAECMVEEFDGTYGADDFQPLIDGRGDYTGVDLQLLEDMVVAEHACTEVETDD